MIADEELWMEDLRAWNNVAHSYNKRVALDIISQTKERFYPMLEKLKKEMEEKWLS